MATSMVKGNPMKLMLQFAFPLLIGNQQCTVSCARLLYGKLHGIQCSGCKVFRCRKA